jgi:hypothetical protein
LAILENTLQRIAQGTFHAIAKRMKPLTQQAYVMQAACGAHEIEVSYFRGNGHVLPKPRAPGPQNRQIARIFFLPHRPRSPIRSFLE